MCTYTYHIDQVLCFSAANAFIGTVTTDVGAPTNDNQTLLYQTYMAAPYIPCGDGYTEEKWSGTHEAGNNDTPLGQVMDAFAHHLLINSNYTAVIVDLQGNNPEMTFLTKFLTRLSFYNLGIICPNGDVILFDLQMHMYVNLVIY